MKNVKDISRISKINNSEFYIIIYPWAETLEYGEDHFSWQDFSYELCEYAECTKVINTFPIFIKTKNKFSYWKKQIYFLEDIHLNKQGNRLVSEVIYENVFK